MGTLYVEMEDGPQGHYPVGTMAWIRRLVAPLKGEFAGLQWNILKYAVRWPWKGGEADLLKLVDYATEALDAYAEGKAPLMDGVSRRAPAVAPQGVSEALDEPPSPPRRAPAENYDGPFESPAASMRCFGR